MKMLDKIQGKILLIEKLDFEEKIIFCVVLEKYCQ